MKLDIKWDRIGLTVRFELWKGLKREVITATIYEIKEYPEGKQLKLQNKNKRYIAFLDKNEELTEIQELK